MERKALLPLSFVAAFVAACVTVGRDHEPPTLELPTTFQESEFRVDPAEAVDLALWWERLGSEKLASLVERALVRNLDLRAALARLDEARALRGVAAADRLPTLDFRASYEHREDSENTPFGEFVPRSDIHAASLEAAWELDLWGRVRRLVEAATRDLEAAEEDVRAVAVSVAAETALAYTDLVAFDRRIRIARTNVELQESTVALVRSRFDAGLVGERDVAQAAANVASTRARVYTFEAGRRAAENRLAVLLGVPPGALAEELADADVPTAAPSLAVGVPADLLRRRPDVRRAERAYAAEIARIGVAEGDRYPRLALSGTIGLASDGAADFFSRDSFVAAFGPSLRWTIFDTGRLRQRVEAQSARADAAEIAWERAVLLALEEAENAMTGLVREIQRRSALEDATTAARRASDLARTDYREGLTDFQAVLDSERVVAGLEDELAVSDLAVTSRLVGVYRAMGGGFDGAAAREIALAGAAERGR